MSGLSRLPAAEIEAALTRAGFDDEDERPVAFRLVRRLDAELCSTLNRKADKPA
jgi:hypothetical protein